MNLHAPATVSPALMRICEAILPYLPIAEQVVYFRLCYVTHFQGSDRVSLRYEDLARTCNLSLSALQKALKGLRNKKLVTTTWNQKSPTLFLVHIVSLTPQKPKPTTPPRAIYDRFSADDRMLFLTAKRSLSAYQLAALEKEAAEWLDTRFEDHDDTFLRDKLDELILQRTFGPDRAKKYEALFLHLYQ